MKQIVSYRAWFWDKFFGLDIGSLSDAFILKNWLTQAALPRSIPAQYRIGHYFLIDLYTICTIPGDFLIICVANPVKIRFNQLRPMLNGRQAEIEAEDQRSRDIAIQRPRNNEEIVVTQKQILKNML